MDKKVVFVPHCILNQNVRAVGKEKSDGTVKEIVNFFAEAQLLTRELSKDYGANVRLPTLKEDFTAFQKLKLKSYSSEWKAEFLDGSFLMVNPDVRIVNHPRKYDFHSQFTIIETSKYSSVRSNGNLCWLGVSKDKYDRAAFTSNFDESRYSVGAIPPLSKDCLGIRLLIDEKIT